MTLTIGQVAAAAAVNIQTMALRVRHGAACDTVERKTRQKIELVKRKMRNLERIKDTLEELAAACASRHPTDDCPILEALDDRAVSAQ